MPTAEGSMIRPGKPFLSDANEWYDRLVWPDIESWDWEGSAKGNNGTYLKPDKFNACMFLTGWYERLITFIAEISDPEECYIGFHASGAIFN